MALIHHNVTELYEKETRVTWVYNDYTPVGPSGLLLPAKLTLYQGCSDSPDVDAGASYTVGDYRVNKDQPKASLYQAPANASINDQ